MSVCTVLSPKKIIESEKPYMALYAVGVQSWFIRRLATRGDYLLIKFEASFKPGGTHWNLGNFCSAKRKTYSNRKRGLM